MAPPVDFDVVIAGAGPFGLGLSIILSDLGVKHVVLEAQPTTAKAPKAHITSQRSLEIFRQHGFVEPIVKAGAPPEKMSRIVWQTSLAGDGPLDRKVFGRVDCWGCRPGSQTRAAHEAHAPHNMLNLPLLHMEPILLDVVRARNPGGILFNHAVGKVAETADGHVLVEAEKRGAAADPSSPIATFRARYVVAADGGKSINKQIGVVLDGIRPRRPVTSFVFRADLSRYWDDRASILHLMSPNGSASASGALLALGPTWGRFSENWQCHKLNLENNQYDLEGADKSIREFLKLAPDHPLQVDSVNTWEHQTVLANKYRQGRIFVGGDAAHQHPPTGGLGLNTAVQDAHNLAWKLAMVLKGTAPESLLDSYEPERRAAGRTNCAWAWMTFRRHATITAAAGMRPGETEYNEKHLAQFFNEEGPEAASAAASRAIFQEVLDGQRAEFEAEDIDLGFQYQDPASAVVFDSVMPYKPARKDLDYSYTPSTLPGMRLPHVWLTQKDKLLSTIDLVRPGGSFYLFVGKPGVEAWTPAVKAVASKLGGVRVELAVIAQPMDLLEADDIVDTEEIWPSIRGVGKTGAVLVRPDLIVGWRAQDSADAVALVSVMEHIIRGTSIPSSVKGQISARI